MTTQQRIERIAEQTTCKIYAQCDEYWHDIPCRHRDRIKELIASALTAFAEEQEKDVERMNWLEANLGRLEHCTWHNVNLGRLVTFGEEATLGECKQTLRQAIDKAMPAPSTGEKPE